MVIGGVEKFIQQFKKEKSNCHLTIAKVKDPSRFGVPEIKGNNIVGVEEKPAKPKSDYAVAGIYLYDSTIFEAVNSIQPSARGELEISDAHQYLLDHHYKISYSEITGWWKDTGKPEDLLEANRLVLSTLTNNVKGKVDQKSTLAGEVEIGKGSRIIGSHIRGPVIIGNNTVIENSYIGPYTSIHNQTEVINSEIEFSIIMENCKIHNVGIRIESSILGSNVDIIKAKGIPKTHRFILGTQSMVELF
jgi:glucose-1-phosphate thymidylyltransferase